MALDAADKVAEPIELSILVVSYNTRELTLAALRSAIRETSHTSYEIIVVDNASSDGSAAAIAAEFPQVRLMALAHNIGFAAANNRASVEARGEFLLLLNPDTVVLDSAIDRLVHFARREPMARIWGGRTLYADHRLNPSSCWGRLTLWNLFCRASGLTGVFRNTEFFNGEAYGAWQRDRVRAVDIVSGCFFLIGRQDWHKLGGFAPLFFMYGEEADLCLRARAHGAYPMITPEATIVHLGGASERARTDKMIKLLAAKATLIERHFEGLSRFAAHALLAMWPASRWLAYRVAHAISGTPEHRESLAAWAAIWAARKRWSAGYPMRSELLDKPLTTPLPSAAGA
ncbi:MAG: glycosyltransferase family 2 protein [Alphaproteobacteria bacterium]|nr:glycosyltransferase family 2 protein [Alphaproteobacteria bacterium]